MTSMTFVRTLLGATLFLVACSPGPPPGTPDVVRDMRLQAFPVGPSGVPEAARGSQQLVVVETEGRCSSLRVHWGDDDPWTQAPAPTMDSGNIFNHTFGHTYPGADALLGFKSITAKGDGSACIGSATKRILVTPEVMGIAWRLATSTCEDASPVMQTSLANVDYTVEIPRPVPGPNLPRIGQIAVGPGEVYDANGSGQPADNSFPFPGWPRYSVIIMVVPPGLPGPPQLFQGGTSFRFRVAQPNSKIRLCYNSNRMPPDTTILQAFQLNVRADASNAVIPP